MNCKFQQENSSGLTNTLKEESAGYTPTKQPKKPTTASSQGFSRPPEHIHLLLKGQSSELAQVFCNTVTEFVCTTAKVRLHL